MENSDSNILFFTDSRLPDGLMDRGFRYRVIELGSKPEIDKIEFAIIDGRSDSQAALDCCGDLKARFPKSSVTYISPDPESRIAALRLGADAVLADANSEECNALISSQFRRKELSTSQRRKAEDADCLSRQLQQAFGQIKLDLEMAGRLQASFLPKSLPEIGKVRFASHYRPCGPVGGDFYDVIRLDERHVGFYVADVMGHGVPAGLLTIYLKRAVTTKDISPTGYRIVPPHDVLGRLNREIIAAEIAEQPFATMAYGIVNVDTGKVTLSRAAHPFPIVVSANGNVESWEVTGKMLGVFESEFQTESRQLCPGDKLLLSTDGAFPERGASEQFDNTELIRAIKGSHHLPVTEFVQGLATQFIERRDLRDDATLLALEMLA